MAYTNTTIRWLNNGISSKLKYYKIYNTDKR